MTRWHVFEDRLVLAPPLAPPVTHYAHPSCEDLHGGSGNPYVKGLANEIVGNASNKRPQHARGSSSPTLSRLALPVLIASCR